MTQTLPQFFAFCGSMLEEYGCWSSSAAFLEELRAQAGLFSAIRWTFSQADADLHKKDCLFVIFVEQTFSSLSFSSTNSFGLDRRV